MKPFTIGLLSFFCLILFSCIGDDIVLDAVDPEVRITSRVASLQAGDTFQFEAKYFNNVGKEVDANIAWTSSDETVASINAQGLATAIGLGTTEITGSTESEGANIETKVSLEVLESEVVIPTFRTATIQSTSSYVLKGTADLSESSNNSLTLSVDEAFETTDRLPGLYVYLTNNPSSIANAFEIGEVTTFEGAHSYSISGVGLYDFSYVLFYCKPYNVKVGDALLSE